MPGWQLPQVRTWPVRVIAVNFVQLTVVLLAGLTWERWLSSWSVLHLRQHLSPTAGGCFAYFIATFVFYWWHRWRHRIDFLWLTFHQIHHSPQRIEVITSFYKHPFEMIVNSIIGSLLVYTFLGLDLKAGAIYTFCTAAGEFFYHTNVKTPRWFGTSSSDPRCIAFTMNTPAIKTTTETLFCGTCSSEPMRILKNSGVPAVLTTRKNSNCSQCCN